ncbi:beta-1,6-N-acetylglucosaminyltransferase [Leuconostoc lactis]|uniref:Peptide O-xylosyltransferase n=1 Tax=Leuconostoc lactis TaxID=1246 RepID=A0AAP9ED86_LEULA|nr:beta-1,6-N-acetylglucosaminyltransferase [Leuconostoc lactis]QEA44299.1 beta-1,6-N-acetylglucosaminyltransferase [Leuconostoc lactis]
MLKKHAYLIISHHNFEQLMFLLSTIDYNDNDIFIMIDRKSNISRSQLDSIKNSVIKSKIFFTKRINIYWGDYSQILAELELIQLAVNTGSYDYFHILSGDDLPLQSQDKIHKFFDEHPQKVFLSLADRRVNFQNIIDRVKYYHISPKLTGRSKSVSIMQLSFYFRALDHFFLLIQKLLKINLVEKYHLEVDYASNWMSIDFDTAKLILENKKWISKVFRHSITADELFVPILLKKHNLYNKIFNNSRIGDDKYAFQGSLNYVNWWDGSPYTWQDGDEVEIDWVIRKGHFFSRKFNLEKSPILKEFIVQKLNDEK